MFGFTRKTDYALVALATLAKGSATSQAPLSARQIAEQYGLPLPLLMQLLKDLHRAGVLHSVRGAGGGYYLAVPPEKISVARVVEIIEDPVRVTVCCEDAGKEEHDMQCTCNLAERCPIVGDIRKLNDKIVAFLGEISILDLTGQQGIDVPVSDVGTCTCETTHTQTAGSHG